MTGRLAAPPPRRRGGALLGSVLAAASVWLAGCAQLAPLPPPEAGSFSGRLAIRIDALETAEARAFSAAFDLRGDARDGVLGLSTPLGSMLARASWKPAEVVLVTPKETRTFADLAELTREVLGESVPVEAWFDWLRGRPWPGAPSAASPSGETGAAIASNASAQGDSPARFEQLGWAVDTSRLGEGRVVAVRLRPAPAVTVRIQLDRS